MVVFGTGSYNVLISSTKCTSNPGCAGLKYKFNRYISSRLVDTKGYFYDKFAAAMSVRASSAENVTVTTSQDITSVVRFKAPGFSRACLKTNTPVSKAIFGRFFRYGVLR